MVPSHLFASLASLLVLSHQVSGNKAGLYNTIIHTKYGTVKGYPAFNDTPSGNIPNWQDITVWKGIPFAASTAYENRWRAPKPRATWGNTTLFAKDFGPECLTSSMGGGTFGNGSTTTGSEDCLNLNIWTSGLNITTKLPVVIWSYPAGGSDSQPLFDGAGMASQGIVFVNFNYRFSSFAWLAHPELSHERYMETGFNSSGNYGMLDQFAALKWVYENIEDFGGDPERITAMGQSAGSASTYHMVNSPFTKGLIKGAIIESGLRSPYDPIASTLAEGYINLTTSLTQGINFAASRNVSTIAELRRLPPSSLVVPFHPPGGDPAAFNFAPTLDYYAIPNKYIYTLEHGPSNDVPVITGNTRDESGAQYNFTTTVSQYLQNLNTTYGAAFAAKFLNLYPASTDAEAGPAENQIYIDINRASSYLFGNLWQLTAKSPIYTYFWDHAPPGQNRGAYHESEINYVLNNLYGTNLPWKGIDYEIAEKMNGYWANFIKTGNPNFGGSYRGSGTLSPWFASTPYANLTQRLGEAFGPIQVAEPARLALIQEYFSVQDPL